MKNILFVDDEENILAGVRRLLHAERDHWDMHFASSGKAALKEFDLRSFDVVVSDLRMPEMDGAELLTLLAQRQCRAQIILMSGVGGQVLAATDRFAQTLGLSVVGHLRKPFRLAELEAIVTDALQSSKQITHHTANETVSTLRSANRATHLSPGDPVLTPSRPEEALAI